jgi:hypothetical protein
MFTVLGLELEQGLVLQREEEGAGRVAVKEEGCCVRMSCMKFEYPSCSGWTKQNTLYY